MVDAVSVQCGGVGCHPTSCGRSRPRRLPVPRRTTRRRTPIGTWLEPRRVRCAGAPALEHRAPHQPVANGPVPQTPMDSAIHEGSEGCARVQPPFEDSGRSTPGRSRSTRRASRLCTRSCSSPSGPSADDHDLVDVNPGVPGCPKRLDGDGVLAGRRPGERIGDNPPRR